uniref:Putative secreted protein n=1 Tax=Lutzomyia longipalpis TaxID=7200 RepID=A0A7G3AMK5_LUTLO
MKSLAFMLIFGASWMPTKRAEFSVKIKKGTNGFGAHPIAMVSMGITNDDFERQYICDFHVLCIKCSCFFFTQQIGFLIFPI